MIDLNSFADGALFERVNIELKKVLENIADPNTDPKKVRKINITIAVAGDQQRDVLNCKVQAKTTLVPATEVESKIVMDYDNDGNLVGQELVSGVIGQTFYDPGEEVIKNDVGDKVVDLRQQSTN
ncbi:replication terminator protein [Bacillus thuringiensis]|uniref:replication terminator protein n=1 Tax=Bacillus thuringiensis TaxID=1428 RepID=UPI000A36D95D|nr:replication terminator protein [Bacillus thuringiensis]OUA60387.1 replication terminator protein [Bacillus thuringiensis serovar bolivia]OUA80040.1 replication terminator protein [Bacillus thuringiensis serovar pahangi]